MSDQFESMGQLLEKYCCALPVQLENLMSLHRAARSNASDRTSCLDEIYREAHRMSGTAACMGFQKIASLLGQLEKFIERHGTPEQNEGETLKVVGELLAMISDAASHVSPSSSSLLVDLDAASARTGS